jgi:hypothetical protein
LLYFDGSTPFFQLPPTPSAIATTHSYLSFISDPKTLIESSQISLSYKAFSIKNLITQRVFKIMGLKILDIVIMDMIWFLESQEINKNDRENYSKHF